jgi:hypothetical protein
LRVMLLLDLIRIEFDGRGGCGKRMREEERRDDRRRERRKEKCFEFIPQNCTKQKDFKMIKMPLIQKTTKVEKQRRED